MAKTRRDRSRAAEAPATPPKGGAVGSARRTPSRGAGGPGGLLFTRWTGIFGVAGIATILAGFFFLAQGSMALAPFLLVLGFLVLIPIALVK